MDRSKLVWSGFFDVTATVFNFIVLECGMSALAIFLVEVINDVQFLSTFEATLVSLYLTVLYTVLTLAFTCYTIRKMILFLLFLKNRSTQIENDDEGEEL